MNVATETWQILGEKLFHRKLKEKLVFQLCRKGRGNRKGEEGVPTRKLCNNTSGTVNFRNVLSIPTEET